MNAVTQLCEACGEAPVHTEYDGFQLCRLCMLDAVERSQFDREHDDVQLEPDSNETLGLRR